MAAFARRDFDVAEAELRALLAVRPGDRNARFNLGYVLEALGRTREAGEAYEPLAAAGDGPALARLGRLRSVQGRLDEAAAYLSRAAAAAPDDLGLTRDLGIVENLRGHFTDSVRLLESVAPHPAADAQTWSALADSLRALRRHDEAEAAVDEALRRDLGLLHARIVRGQLAYDRGDFERAWTAFVRAAELAPQDAEPELNLGVLAHGLGRLDEALEHLRRAVALAPDNPLAHFDLGMTLLLGGDFPAGFAECEWRLRDPHLRRDRLGELLPRWDGAARAGTVVVTREQGLGDFLLWSRLFPAARARGVRLAVECPAALAPLFAGFPGIDELLPPQAPREPRFAAAIPLCSLPLVLGLEAAAIPPPLPPAVDRARTAAFRARFAALGARRTIGIVWAGEPAHALDRFRSSGLDAFAALATVPDVAWVSLQKGSAAREALAPPAGLELLRLDEELHDFGDTAAAVAALDLVIAVDTSVAHLAGTLGVPVWLLHGFGNHWLWQLDRTDSPWYPSLRIFRQHQPNRWDGVFADVRAALERTDSVTVPNGT
ncbi:MAG TPA: tetratricopeptide repeat-containing glycosyltransferase family protein [Candidatus Sulfotelmatobacter sp.]|nr:tetratricopeptide repeat-containing glycosyltransferase family protein [Candidatus Sulfotelmatobacter sp.]